METEKTNTKLNYLTKEMKDEINLKRVETADKYGVPLRYALGLDKVLRGVGSPREAIKAKCLACVGYEDTSERIKECNVKRCPLYAYRPYK